MSRIACYSPFLALLLTACGSTEVIPEPVVIETVRTEFVPIPPDLLAVHVKSEVPESLTWSELAQLWVADRENLDKANANLKAIAEIGKNLPDIDARDSIE